MRRDARPTFPGLNALRFFAAYLVLLHHAEQIRAKSGLFNLKRLTIFNCGGPAVSFFFVLSGFLITYLLMIELHTTNRVDVVKFYVRRTLRIWPLYFLTVAIGLFLVPAAVRWLHLSYRMPYRASDVLPLFLVFAPFLVNLRYEAHPLEPLWSIGVEEVFYLAWAPLFSLFRRRLLLLLSAVVLIKIALLASAEYLAWSPETVRLLRMLQFEAMAFGGLGALWIRTRGDTPLPPVLFSKTAQGVLLAVLASEMTARASLSELVPGYGLLFDDSWLAPWVRLALFLWLIVNVSVNPHAILKLRSPVLNRLGEISYGIYMYQMLVATGVALLFRSWLARLGAWPGTAIFYALASGGTIAVAELSKRWFEDPFLRYKERFAPKPPETVKVNSL